MCVLYVVDCGISVAAQGRRVQRFVPGSNWSPNSVRTVPTRVRQWQPWVVSGSVFLILHFLFFKMYWGYMWEFADRLLYVEYQYTHQKVTVNLSHVTVWLFSTLGYS